MPDIPASPFQHLLFKIQDLEAELQTIRDSVADLDVTVQDSELGTKAHVSHFGTLKTGSVKPIVEGNFPGSTLNRTTWLEQGSQNTTLADGLGTLEPTGAAEDVVLLSRKPGRFVASQVTVFQAGVFPEAPNATGTLHEWGLRSKDGQQGLFFRQSDGAFTIVTLRDGVENEIAAANFNGEAGYTLSNQNRTWRIFYSAGRAIFCDSVAGNVRKIHTEVDSQAPLVDGLDLHGYFRSENTTATSGSPLKIRGFSIGIWSEFTNNDLAFERNSVDDGTLPSGPAYVVPAVPDASPPANVFDSGYFLRNERDGLFTHVDVQTVGSDLKVYIIDSSDTSGTTSQGLDFPNLNTADSTLKIGTVAAPGFKKYARIVVVNESGVDCDNYFIGARWRRDEDAIFLSLSQVLFEDFPAPLVQSVIKGKVAGTSTYQAVDTDGKGRLTITGGSEFARILARQVENDDRLLVDAEPGTGYVYIGSAPRGTAQSATEWGVVKVLMSGTLNPQDIQYKADIAWTDRTNAAHWDTTA